MKNIYIILFLINCIFANAQTDTIVIKQHLINITKSTVYRNYRNIEELNKIANYIFNDFKKYSDSVYFQEYKINDKTYKNVICTFGNENQKTIVIGAHYDVCGDQEGADDNASGVIGLLELAKQFKGQKLNNRIELVAYTLEEPPYFRTQNMGSFVHAKSLKDNNRNVFGMVSLEMIGYFDEAKHSQDYPIGIMSWFYGNKGNYITLVNKFGKGKFARQFSKNYINTKVILTKKLAAPKSLPGIDFSDHLNYWNFGFSALMLTDTSFYRNKNYHEKTDTMGTLNINKMAKVIDGVFQTIISL
jgi:Zn-dependent M28 family amino/carboxypeptidase